LASMLKKLVWYLVPKQFDTRPRMEGQIKLILDRCRKQVTNVICCLVPCGYAGTVLRVRGTGGGYAGMGTRVNRYGYNGIFPKKKLTGPSQTRIRVLVYSPIPGYGYRGYGPRVHGYGLYPAGFSKPLDIAHPLSTPMVVRSLDVKKDPYRPEKIMKKLLILKYHT
jgi:hypothetical protein